MSTAQGETDHCRSRLMKYCQGQGLDLGCGITRIKTDAIGIDLYSPHGDMRADARTLEDFPDNQFDYIYSSHLLEELDNTEATLKQWIRVVKDGGYIVLYQADKDLYYTFDDPKCNPKHKHHFSWEALWAIFERIGGTVLIHHDRHPELKEWSFELVVQKSKDGKAVLPQIESSEGISILVPTLNRPHNIERFSCSVDRTAKKPQVVEIVFGVHDDDQASKDKIAELNPKLGITLRCEIIKRYKDGRTHLSYLWNQIYDRANHDILGYFGDDVIFKTPGWDKTVLEEFQKDRAVLVACNDIHCQRGKYATLFFTHRQVHERVGFYLKPNFRRWFADTFWDNVYKRADKMHYHEEIITEHIHPDAFPDKADAVYKAMDAFKEADRKRWNSQKNGEEIAYCSEIISRMQKLENIISFSIWGKDPKYLIGAVENAKLQKTVYPDWVCRFYIAEDVPQDTVEVLKGLGAEVVIRPTGPGSKGLFWRFEPAFDVNVGRFIVRDCDSRLNAREASAVAEWIESGLPFHCMRDHQGHDVPILGAMWGAEAFFVNGFKEMYQQFLDKAGERVIKREQYFYTDQIFLREKIWPLVKDKAIVHDDRARFTGTERPFLVKLPEGQFVGQQWGADNKPLVIPI